MATLKRNKKRRSPRVKIKYVERVVVRDCGYDHTTPEQRLEAYREARYWDNNPNTVGIF